MANVNKVNGFRPFRYLNGSPYNGAVTKYVVPAADTTALFVGDIVKLEGTNDSASGLRTVIQSAAGDASVGVVVGFEVDPTNLNTPQYRAASTRRIVYVCDDPNVLLISQEDGDTDPLETTDMGQNVNFIVGSGSTVTGASGMQLDSTTHATTVTLPFKLMEFVATPDNENVLSTGGQAYSRWVVKWNVHQLVSTSAA